MIVFNIGLKLIFNPTKLDFLTWGLAQITSNGLFIAIFYWLLSVKKYQIRFHKTVMAWFGTDTILIVIQKILLVGSSFLTGVIGIFLIAWVILVKSYIVKKSLELSNVMSIVTLVGMIVVSAIPLMLFVKPESIWTQVDTPASLPAEYSTF